MPITVGIILKYNLWQTRLLFLAALLYSHFILEHANELKSLAWKDEYGTPYEKHHMPAANTLPTSIPYEEGACGNVPPKIHDQTFTNGLNESNRPYDYALYNSLTYEDKLAFDNKNLKDLYAKMKPEADQKEIAKRIDANYEFSMQVKESHPESTKPEGTCPDK